MEEPDVKNRYKLVATYYIGEAKGNAEKACIMAGYSPRYARGNAYKIVANSGTQKYIKYLNSKLENGNIANIEKIQSFWSRIMMDGEEKMQHRLRASELLAKSKGLFNNDW